MALNLWPDQLGEYVVTTYWDEEEVFLSLLSFCEFLFCFVIILFVRFSLIFCFGFHEDKKIKSFAWGMLCLKIILAI